MALELGSSLGPICHLKARNRRFYWFMGDKHVGWIVADDLAAVSAQVLAVGAQKHASKQYWLSTEVMNGVEAARGCRRDRQRSSPTGRMRRTYPR
jgi:hypothetical protein